MSKQVLIEQFLKDEFPQSQCCSIETLLEGGAVVRYRVTEQDLRPGATVSGPTMMTIADFAMYIAILSEIGLAALAVTSQLNIHFLRKPQADRDLIAKCQLLKIGKTLVTGEIKVYSEGQTDAVAQVTATYVLPST